MSSSLKTRSTLISQRWVFTILASTGLCIQNIFSVIMPITIIEMVMKTENLEVTDNKACSSFYNATLENNTFFTPQIEENPPIERYPWDEYTQGIILSSFCWSSAFAEFFHGMLAERFGGKYLLGFAILAQAVITLLTPSVINWGGSTALIITRVIMGLASDGMFPVVSTMIPHWSIPAERTKIGNAIYGGSVLGLFFGNIMPALIMKYSNMGWPAVFYFVGILGIIWCPLWLVFVYENPEVHPLISKKEFEYLRSSLTEGKLRRSKLPPAPWRRIFRCKEFWVFTFCYMGSNCSYYIMLTGLPRYMGNVIKFPIETNGYLSALPFLFMWLNTYFSTWINKIVLEKQWMSLTNVRKLLTVVSVTGPGIFLVLASYAGCDKVMVVVMFLTGVALIGSCYPSLFMNPIDLSPNYAGSLMSAASGMSQSVAILAPYLIGVLVPNSTITEWRLVFWMVLSFTCCSSTAYLVWYKAEVQAWNEPETEETECVKEKEEVELKLMS